MIRPNQFVDALPSVMPNVLDVTELSPDYLRGRGVVRFAITSPSPNRQSASVSFEDGVPTTPGVDLLDIEQLETLPDLHKSLLMGDRHEVEVMLANATESSLAALLRISEADLSEIDSRSKKKIGKLGLYVVRTATINSMFRRAATRSGRFAHVQEAAPEEKIPAHREAYEALLPYMHRATKKYIREILETA